MAVMTAAGPVLWWVFGRWHGALSFLAGAALSWLSFLLLHRFVRDVDAALGGAKPNPLSFLLHAFRTLILGGAAYVIVKVYEATPLALATGLLVTVASAAAAALVDTIYARRTMVDGPAEQDARGPGQRSAD